MSRSARTRDRAAAERFLERMLEPLGLGMHRVPLGEVWRAYERSAARREQAAATLASKRAIWLRFAAWLDSAHPEIAEMGALTPEAAAEYVRAFRARHSAGTSNNAVCVLREIWRCVACGGAGVAAPRFDPWAGVRLLPCDSHARRGFTRDELERVVAAAGRAGGELPLLFSVGLHTGLRLGDCCLLSWEEIDFPRGVIQVIPRKTRRYSRGRPVTIPMHAALETALRGAAEGTNAREGRVMPQLADWYLGARWRLSHALEGVFEAAGIRTSLLIDGRVRATPDATFHSLRHSFVSFAANAGVPLPVVASMVGHASAAMTRHYFHESEEELRRAVDAVPTVGAGAGGARQPEMARATGGGAAAPVRAVAPAERLRQLAECLSQGLVTPDEYAARRAAIIDAI